ncbi:MAG: SirB2 family protein [Nitrosomonadales bacterium]|nr:SirB2 family protein [Nitrosomonadales bacterium]
MDLLVVKTVHVACVAASYTLFFLRGVWLLQGSPIMRQRWVKVVPHITDTLLLASAVALAIGIRQYPGTDAWLTAKVAGMLLYIGLGMVAFRFSKTLRTRIVSWVAAQLVFFYIVAVARAHSPLPFIAQ